MIGSAWWHHPPCARLLGPVGVREEGVVSEGVRCTCGIARALSMGGWCVILFYIAMRGEIRV